MPATSIYIYNNIILIFTNKHVVTTKMLKHKIIQACLNYHYSGIA